MRSAVCGVAIRKGGKQVALGLADGTRATLDVSGATPKETSAQPAHAHEPPGPGLIHCYPHFSVTNSHTDCCTAHGYAGPG